MKVILNSKAYQSQAYSVQQADKKYLFDGPVLRRMSAENIWDSFLSLQMENPDAGLPDGFKHDGFTYFYELSQKMGPKEFEEYILKHKFNRGSFYNFNHKIAEKEFKGEKRKAFMRASEFRHPIGGSHPIKMFGQSTREIIDGANQEPNIPQTLLMINGDFEESILRQGNNYLHQNLSSAKTDKDKLEVLFLSILNRYPNNTELAKFKDLKLIPENIKDLMWAMLNSNEFKFKR